MKRKDFAEEYLKIYKDKSIYVCSEKETIYLEGPQSETAKANQEKIKKELDNGFLDNVFQDHSLSEVEIRKISNDLRDSVHALVNSITSEVGRAIVGLTVLQLTVKSIIPEQSIRLHKSSHNRASFSWVDGIPMRVIDHTYITPKLREYDLLKLNADGFMMTRSLAENYPYTSLYKANIRGAKDEWVAIVNAIEEDPKIALISLKLLISLLKQKSKTFKDKVAKSKDQIRKYLKSSDDFKKIQELLFSFPEKSSYSARLFEILIHSFYATLSDEGRLSLFLKPLSQMRSANKKHGNIGDIELLEKPNSMLIAEAWDAKYGKNYLRDELEELKDKLENHPETRLAGFISSLEPLDKEEISIRKSEIEEEYGVKILFYSIQDWYSESVK